MKGSISRQDQEHVSAYLDGQLSAGEQARLEARLQVEPRLRQEVADLRATARSLRGLPQVRVPRNFTLSPEQARRYWSLPRFAFPTLRLATAFATAAFAFVLVLDFNASGRPPQLLSGAAPEQAREIAQAPSMDAAAEVAPAATDSGMGEAELDLSTAEEAGTQAQTAPGATPEPTKPSRGQVESPSFAPEEGEPSRVAGGGAGGEGVMPETPIVTKKVADLLQATPLPATATPTSVPSIATQPSGPATAQPEAADEVQLVQAPPSVNPYRPVTLGLAGLAVLLGALTLVVRRFA